MGRRSDATTRLSLRGFALVALALVVMTAALGLAGIQYRSERALPVTVEGAEAHAPVDRIHIRTHPLAVDAEPLAAHTRARLVAALPQRGEEPHWLRLSARLHGEITHIGPDATRPPILATWFTRPDGTRQRVAPSPLEAGHFDAIRWQTVRAWPADSTSVVVTLMPRAARGEMTLSDFTVEILALAPTYQVLLVLLASAWAMLALIATHYVWKRFEGPAALVPLALATLIGAAVMFSTDFIDSVVRPIVSLVHGSRAGISLVTTFKIGHGVAFALLTVSLLSVRRQLNLSVRYCVTLIALLAIASEAAQLHLPARTAKLSDLGIDAAGMLLALLAWATVLRLRRRRLRGRRLHRAAARDAKRAVSGDDASPHVPTYDV